MYHDFFGLQEPAFSIAVNPRYLFMSDQHREALAHLLYGIQNGGFVMLTGEVGTGKTTIIRCLLEQLPANTDIAIILNPMGSAPELLSTICDELGVGYAADDVTVKNLTDALNQFLLDNHRRGRKTVLLIDEAQLLRVPVLEQIRLLTNLETTTEKLLQIMLVGQPELKKLLARPALRQLSQRITARFHLEALNVAETKAYIAHRLKVAGLPEYVRPFSDSMIKKIHRFSGGIPRLINVLCERLLLGAYAKNTHNIDSAIFNAAVKEVAGTNTLQEEKIVTTQVSWHTMFVVLLMGIMLAVWFWYPNEMQVATASTSTSSEQGSSLNSSQDSSAQSSQDIPTLQSELPEIVAAFATRDIAAAQLGLFAYLDVPVKNESNPCARNLVSLYVCEKLRVNSWDELKEINRPGLITLVTPDKKWVYALLIGLSENQVMVLSGGEHKTLLWSDISSLWNGDFLYVWSKPLDFNGSLKLGDKSDVVTWVAEQFAILDQQPAPLAREFFTDRLKLRVELFQSTQHLIPDGVIGAETLRRLNLVLGIDKSLVELHERHFDAAPIDEQGL
jgi:general secretion pathway protein A